MLRHSFKVMVIPVMISTNVELEHTDVIKMLNVQTTTVLIRAVVTLDTAAMVTHVPTSTNVNSVLTDATIMLHV